MSPNPLLSLLDSVDPYLPSSLTTPLYTVLTTPSSALSDPSQLLPLALTLFAAYAAFLSFYSTLRTTYRVALFALKWGTAAAVLGAGYSAYSNVGTEQGALSGLRNAQQVAQRVYAVGRTGVDWWMGSQANTGAKGARSTRLRRRGAGTRKSASGVKRTWATATDDGGWDDPAEVDLGAGADNDDTADVLGFVRRAAMTFLAPGQHPNAGSADGRPRAQTRARTQAKAKAKKASNKAGNKNNNGADDLGSLATEYAMGRARRAWNDFMGGGRQ